MADSDCSECRYNHNYGGKCPYDEYNCVFYPLYVLSPETIELAIDKTQKLKAAFDELELILGSNTTCAIGAATYEIDNICEIFSRDKLEEYKAIIKGDNDDG